MIKGKGREVGKALGHKCKGHKGQSKGLRPLEYGREGRRSSRQRTVFKAIKDRPMRQGLGRKAMGEA